MPDPPSTPRRPACFMIHDLADKLLVYECRHIDESFIKKLKKEMHSLSMMQRVIMTWIESLQLDSIRLGCRRGSSATNLQRIPF